MKTYLLALLLVLTISIGATSSFCARRPEACLLSLPAFSGCSSDTCG